MSYTISDVLDRIVGYEEAASGDQGLIEDVIGKLFNDPVAKLLLDIWMADAAWESLEFRGTGTGYGYNPDTNTIFYDLGDRLKNNVITSDGKVIGITPEAGIIHELVHHILRTPFEYYPDFRTPGQDYSGLTVPTEQSILLRLGQEFRNSYPASILTADLGNLYAVDPRNLTGGNLVGLVIVAKDRVDSQYNLRDIDVSDRSDDVLLVGSSLGNEIEAGSGSDYLFGASGADLLRGLAGNDSFVSGAGADTMLGGDGVDLASYRGYAAAVTLTIASTGAATWELKVDEGATVDHLTGFEHIVLTNQSDVVSITHPDQMAALTNLQIHALNTGAPGEADRLTFEDVTDEDGIEIPAGTGLFGFENIIGSDYNDHLRIEDPGANHIHGGLGDDIIDTSIKTPPSGVDLPVIVPGPDTIEGGAGNDTIILAADEFADVVIIGEGDDVVRGGDENDRLVFRADVFEVSPWVLEPMDDRSTVGIPLLGGFRVSDFGNMQEQTSAGVGTQYSYVSWIDTPGLRAHDEAYDWYMNRHNPDLLFPMRTFETSEVESSWTTDFGGSFAINYEFTAPGELTVSVFYDSPLDETTDWVAASVVIEDFEDGDFGIHLYENFIEEIYAQHPSFMYPATTDEGYYYVGDITGVNYINGPYVTIPPDLALVA